MKSDTYKGLNKGSNKGFLTRVAKLAENHSNVPKVVRKYRITAYSLDMYLYLLFINPYQQDMIGHDRCSISPEAMGSL